MALASSTVADVDSLGAPPVPSPRRIEARRLARVLLPAYHEVGWVSTRLQVRMGRRWVTPDLAAVIGEPPVDGRMGSAPRLVVVLRPARAAQPTPREWLDAGADAVWEVGNDVVVEHRAAGITGLRRRGERVRAPGRRCGIAVHDLLPRPGQRSAKLG